jgi:hypothetical protein
LLIFTTLRELTTVYHAFTLNVDMIDCRFCGAMRLASDCSCLSLAMRLSRFLCANPAYPHPLDRPGAHMGNAQIAPLGSCPWSQISRQANRQVRLSQLWFEVGAVAAPPVHAPGGRKAGLVANTRKGLQSTYLPRPIPEIAYGFLVSLFAAAIGLSGGSGLLLSSAV